MKFRFYCLRDLALSDLEEDHMDEEPALEITLTGDEDGSWYYIWQMIVENTLFDWENWNNYYFEMYLTHNLFIKPIFLQKIWCRWSVKTTEILYNSSNHLNTTKLI